MSDDFVKAMGDGLKLNAALAPFTTIGIGGPAKYLHIAHNSRQLALAVKNAIKFKVPFYVLGNGSNVLISDRGYDGLVVINLSSQIKIEVDSKLSVSHPKTKPRLEQPGAKEFYDFSDLDYDEPDAPQAIVTLDSGVLLTNAIEYLLNLGITGFQWFAGIPASIGGAVFMNAHGGNRFIGDYLLSASLIDQNAKTKTRPHDYFKFNFDYSVLHETKETILTSTFRLQKGDREKAIKVAREWANRKSVQPQRSLGSTFQNLTDEQKQSLAAPTSAAGFVIDKLLGLRGNLAIGDAIVSPRHANFIENWGRAQASDVYQIVQQIKSLAKEKLGLDLKEEIQYLGEFS